MPEKPPATQATAPEEKTPPPKPDPRLTDHLNIGKFHLDRGEYTDAIAEFEAAKAIEPGNKDIPKLIEQAKKGMEAEREILLAR